MSGVGVLATYSYDDLGRRTATTFGNGAAQAFGYDPVSRLASLTNNLTGTANDLSVTFAYNPASQIASTVRTGDAYAWTGHGNGTTASVANGLNQLTSIGGSATTHDTKGNLTTDPTNGKTYAYSSENMLTSATGGVTLAYDPMLRLYQLAGASTTRFAYDGLDMIAEYDGANALQRRFVHGPGTDEPIVWYEGSGTTDRRFLGADERGSVISVSDGTGVMLNLNRYDEYGKPQATNTGRFQYTGQTWLPEVGVYYYKARMYSPTFGGRFLQTDPIDVEGGINLYAYVENDPVNLTDPLGLMTMAQCMAEQAKARAGGGATVVCGSSLDGVASGGRSGGSGGAGNDNPRPPPSGRPRPPAPPKPPEKEKKAEEEAKDLENCLIAVGTAGLEGFADPISVMAGTFGAAKSTYEARNRIAREDYGRPENRFTFPRDYSSAIQIGLKRFLPGYALGSAIVGGVNAVKELGNNPSCGIGTSR